MPSFDELFAKVNKEIAKAKDPACSIKRSGDITLSSRIPYGIPSGLPQLELAIGRPGIPAGRVTEFYGFERSGKTTAAYHVLASAQKAGGGGMFIDAESSWDEERAAACGVDPDKNFRIGEVENIEAIFRLLLRTLEAMEGSPLDKPFVFVVDSVTGVESEINEDANTFGKEARIGQDARLIRRGIRLANKKIANTKAAVIFINHAIATANSYGPKSMAAGGHGLKLFSSLRVSFASAGEIQDDKKGTDVRYRHGQKSKLKVEKLKGSKLLFQEFEIDLLDDGGFDTVGSLLEAAELTGWVERVNQKTYKMNDQEFPPADWKHVVQTLGGREMAYRTWIDWCLKNGKLDLWNNWNG